jgi:hypothetical protein
MMVLRIVLVLALVGVGVTSMVTPAQAAGKPGTGGKLNVSGINGKQPATGKGVIKGQVIQRHH